MLVPLVLRSIVLPYLRSTTSATSSSTAATRVVVVAGTGTTRALSTSTGRARAVEAALAREPDDAFRRTWHDAELRRRSDHLRHRDRDIDPIPPRPPPLETRRHKEEDEARSRVSTPEVEESGASELQLPSHASATSMAGEPKRIDTQQPVDGSTHIQPVKRLPFKRDVFDKVPGPPPLDVPPAIAQLLRAKLFRMVVFHILETPEYLADVYLMEYVIGRLEKHGAGRLAARLRRSLDHWRNTPEEEREGTKPRLLSEPRHNTEKRPPTYWRLPNTPRDPSEYSGTPSERRTHYYNHRITSYLTVQHAAPYDTHGLPRQTPFPVPPSAKLSRISDVLRLIDRLRRNNNFVPDRVTANIVVKAWMMSLSRHREWLALPLMVRQRDVRDVFCLVASSIEKGSEPSMFTTPKGSPESNPPTRFDTTVDYERHVEPFVRTMVQAMKRVGDREGRTLALQWEEHMRLKLEREKLEKAKEMLARQGDVEDAPRTREVMGEGAAQVEAEVAESGQAREAAAAAANEDKK